MGRILVVDDHEDTAKVLARLLRSSGHSAEYVTSGEAALARAAGGACAAHPASPRPPTTDPAAPPDLMILDFMMPGMDGMEVLRRLKAQPETAGIRVVLYSAVFDPSFEQHAREKGAADYWPKGRTDFGAIAERVQALMAPSRSGAASPA